MRPYGTLALAALIAVTAAFAVFAAYATVQSDEKYYVYGSATVNHEPVSIQVKKAFNLNLAAGDQGTDTQWLMNITKDSNINSVKISVKLTNVAQLRGYFKYLKILLKDEASGEIKGIITLNKPTAVLTLDNQDFDSYNNAKITAIVFYELADHKLFDSVPLLFQVNLLQES